MAVEDDSLLFEGTRIAAALRCHMLSVEVVASGSPRKRYDKATRINGWVLLSLNIRDGERVIRSQSATHSDKLVEVKAILAGLGYPE